MGAEYSCSSQDIQSDVDYTTDALFPPSSDVRKLFDKVKRLILSVDASLEEAPRQLYVTFKKGKSNAVSMWPKDGWIEVVLNAKLGQIKDDDGLLYDISNRKWSAAQYAFRFYDDTDEGAAKKLIEQTIHLKK